jgi:RHS repeat-associated protein
VNDNMTINHQYYDFTAGVKPHLLTAVDNNRGATTLIHYSPSTKFYLADEKAGTPWITRLPFPVQVVEKIETTDHISGSRLVASYSYHHGFFDPVEREFRGFGRVERQDAETFDLATPLESGKAAAALPKDRSHDVPPILTKTWYHTGAYAEAHIISQQYAGEYYKGDKLVSALPDSTLDAQFKEYPERKIEAYRALHGHVLHEEVYGLDHKHNPSLENPKLDEHPYTVTESNFYVKLLQAKADQNVAVCLVHPRETISYHYERNPTAPRIQHTLTLEIDSYGNALKEAAVTYGRPDESLLSQEGLDKKNEQFLKDNQSKKFITYTENKVTNSIDTGDHYLTPLPCEIRTYELSGYTPTGVAGRFQRSDFVQIEDNPLTLAIDKPDISYEDLPTNGKQRHLIEQVRTLYRPDDLGESMNNPLALLGLNTVEPLALNGESYKLAFTPGLLKTVYPRPRSGKTDDTEKLLAAPDTVLPVDNGEEKAIDRGGYVDLDGNGHWWIPTGREFLSPGSGDTTEQEWTHAKKHFFLPHRARDPFHIEAISTESHVTYDNYDLLIIETCDALLNVVKADNDYHVLQPRLITDPNGNRRAVAFDALGMVVATAVMGKENEAIGDLLENLDTNPSPSDLQALQAFIADPQPIAISLLGKATTRLVYDLDRYHRTGQPPFVATLARETHESDSGADQAKIQIGFAYSDGFGREIQTKSQAEAGDAPQRNAPVRFPTGDIRPGNLLHDVQTNPKPASPRWVGSGRTVFNNKGKPVKQYEPFFSSTHLYERETEMTDAGVTSIVFYDPLERVVATLHPNHTFEKVVFAPWRQQTWDVNDTVTTDPRNDPDIAGYVRKYFKTQPENWQTWHAQRIDKPVGDPEGDSARKAAAHAGTPTVAYFDALGRPFLTVTDNGLDPVQPNKRQLFATRVILDIESNHRELIDANGRVAMRYAYDMLGNRIHEASMDAGERWMLNDVAGKPIRAWDSRGHMFETIYDQLRRPIEQRVTGEDSLRPDQRLRNRTVTIEKTEYGESHTNSCALNLRMRVFKSYDGAGVVTHAGHNPHTEKDEAYDFKGNLLRSSRQVVSHYKAIPDWSVSPALEAESFVSATRYDALNRPIQIVAPHSDRTGSKSPVAMNVSRPSYNAANLLECVDVWLQQAEEAKDLLVSATASPHGITNIDYDAKGQRARITYGNGAETRYQYDRNTFRLIQLYTQSGTSFTGDGESATPPHDDPIKAPAVPPAGKPFGLQNLHYTYDPVGNITHIRDDAQQTIYFKNQCIEPHNDYTYDAIYRLVGATGREHLGQANGNCKAPTPSDALKEFHSRLPHPGDGGAMGNYQESYVYDAEDNFLSMAHRGTDSNHTGWSRTYAYKEPSLNEAAGKNNHLTSTAVGGTTDPYTYDAHGNMTSMPHLSCVQWDYRDQIQQSARQVVKHDSTPETTWYVYDASGQRIRQVTQSYADAGETPVQTKERLYLGGFEIYREYENDGNSIRLERETLHIMDDKQSIALVETRTKGQDNSPSQLIRYQFGNHLGSASLELDEGARIISYEEYTPFGSTSYQAARSQTGTPKRYRYSGKERDDSTGLYYYGARYYAPWLGRWLSPDPAGTVDGLNLYAFVSGNPVTFCDPNGLTRGKKNQQREQHHTGGFSSDLPSSSSSSSSSGSSGSSSSFKSRAKTFLSRTATVTSKTATASEHSGITEAIPGVGLVTAPISVVTNLASSDEARKRYQGTEEFIHSHLRDYEALMDANNVDPVVAKRLGDHGARVQELAKDLSGRSRSKWKRTQRKAGIAAASTVAVVAVVATGGAALPVVASAAVGMASATNSGPGVINNLKKRITGNQGLERERVAANLYSHLLLEGPGTEFAQEGYQPAHDLLRAAGILTPDYEARVNEVKIMMERIKHKLAR